MRKAVLPISAMVLTAGFAAAPASGQAVLDSDQLTNYGNAYWYDQKGGQHGTFDGNFTASGTDFDDARKVSFEEDGFSAFVFSHNTTQYNPSSPGIGGSFSDVFVNLDSSSEILATNPKSHPLEEAYGQPYDYIYFTLNQNTDWTWKADVAGSSTKGIESSGQYYFNLFDVTNNAYVTTDSRIAANGDSFQESIFLNGTLPAGQYYVYFDANTRVANPDGLGGLGSATASISSGVFSFTIPAPGSASLIGLVGLLAARRRRA